MFYLAHNLGLNFAFRSCSSGNFTHDRNSVIFRLTISLAFFISFGKIWMFPHARRLQKILLKPIFKNINSLFPRTKYRGMFVFVFGVTNTLRNVFIIYKMVSFILEDNIEVCLLLIPTISGNLPQHNTIRPSLRKRKKQKDVNISQRIIQFTYMIKRYEITWKKIEMTLTFGHKQLGHLHVTFGSIYTIL